MNVSIFMGQIQCCAATKSLFYGHATCFMSLSVCFGSHSFFKLSGEIQSLPSKVFVLV